MEKGRLVLGGVLAALVLVGAGCTNPPQGISPPVARPFFEPPATAIVLPEDQPPVLTGPAAGCVAAKGEWFNDYNECQDVSAEWCQAAGGFFDKCASGCRHNTAAPAGLTPPCALDCVSLCRFGVSRATAADPNNATYHLEGSDVTLKDGVMTEPLPNSAGKKTVRVVGEAASGDLDGDGQDDAAVILTRSEGGSGLFYYVAAAIKNGDGYVGTNAMLLGDRLVPEPPLIKGGVVVVTYRDRYPWQDFSAPPTVVKTRKFLIEGESLTEPVLPALTAETAKALVTKAWGDCAKVGCDQLKVDVFDDHDGTRMVRAVFDGMKDNSIQARENFAAVTGKDGDWRLGPVLYQAQQCHSGRGHQDFSDKPCR